MEIGLPKYLQRENQEVESEPWLLSYSDMTTLLLAFFVLFFAISQLDQTKFEMIMEYFSKTETMPLHQLEKKFKQFIEDHQLQDSMEAELTPNGLLVHFQDKILFDSGKAELKPEAYPVLDALAQLLRQPEVQQRKIEVEGHTDTVPISKNADYPSNWELSAARATRVIRYLIGQEIAPDRFVAVGYADTRLRVPESDGRRGLPVNRRVSLLIK